MKNFIAAFLRSYIKLLNRIKSDSQQHVRSNGKDGFVLCWLHVRN